MSPPRAALFSRLIIATDQGGGSGGRAWLKPCRTNCDLLGSDNLRSIKQSEQTAAGKRLFAEGSGSGNIRRNPPRPDFNQWITQSARLDFQNGISGAGRTPS
jgi:hypothetical protein